MHLDVFAAILRLCEPRAPRRSPRRFPRRPPPDEERLPRRLVRGVDSRSRPRHRRRRRRRAPRESTSVAVAVAATRPRGLRRSRPTPPVGDAPRSRRRRSDAHPRRQREVAQRRERRVRLVASPTSESGTVREHGRDANAIVLGDERRRVGGGAAERRTRDAELGTREAELRRESSAPGQNRALAAPTRPSMHARRSRGPSRGKSRAEGEVYALVRPAGAFPRRGARWRAPTDVVGEIGNGQRPRRPSDEYAAVAVAVDVTRAGHAPTRAIEFEPARIAREDRVERGPELETGPGPPGASARRAFRRRRPGMVSSRRHPAERAVRREGRGVHHRGSSFHPREEIAHAVDGFGEEREACSPGARGGGVRFRDFSRGRSERENFSEATRRAHGDGLDGAALDALRGEENGGEGGDVQHEVCPPSRGREGGGEGYLAVKRRGFHVDEGGGDLEATTRAVLIGEANLEGDVLPGGDHQLEHQVGLLQADCEGGKREGRGTPEGQAGAGAGGGARRRSARRAREKPTDHERGWTRTSSALILGELHLVPRAAADGVYVSLHILLVQAFHRPPAARHLPLPRRVLPLRPRDSQRLFGGTVESASRRGWGTEAGDAARERSPSGRRVRDRDSGRSQGATRERGHRPRCSSSVRHRVPPTERSDVLFLPHSPAPRTRRDRRDGTHLRGEDLDERTTLERREHAHPRRVAPEALSRFLGRARRALPPAGTAKTRTSSVRDDDPGQNVSDEPKSSPLARFPRFSWSVAMCSAYD